MLAGAVAGVLLGTATGAVAQSDPAAASAAPRCERVVVAMGTTLQLEFAMPVGGTRTEALQASEAAVRALSDVEVRLSTWRHDSELSRANAAAQGEWVALSPSSRDALLRAFAIERETGGAFAVGVGALVAAYDLRSGGRWPGADELQALLPAVASSNGFELEAHGEGGRIRRRLATAQLEEGAFGKGAGLVAARDAALAAGCDEVWFDFGGQVLLAGRGAEPRRVAIADPRDRATPIALLELHSGSFATTANSERRQDVDGRQLGHVLDPRTGRPAEDFGSVTVWCEDPLCADALSTALFVMGPDEAIRFAERTDGVEALVVDVRGSEPVLRATAGLASGLRTKTQRHNQ